MNCCNHSMAPLLSECGPPIEDVAQTIRIQLTGNDRKMMKLLLKQYQIYSISQDAPDFQDERIVREMPLIITYFNPEIPQTKFKWKIYTRIL